MSQVTIHNNFYEFKFYLCHYKSLNGIRGRLLIKFYKMRRPLVNNQYCSPRYYEDIYNAFFYIFKDVLNSTFCC